MHVAIENVDDTPIKGKSTKGKKIREKATIGNKKSTPIKTKVEVMEKRKR